MLDSKIDARNTIKKNIPLLVEAFTRFYGEDCRKEIEEKFNKVIVAGYISPSGYGLTISDEKKKLASKYIELFKEETGITSQEAIDTLFGGFPDFTYTPIIEYLNYDMSQEYMRDRLLRFIGEYTGENISSLEEDRAKEVLSELEKLLPYAKKAEERFNEEYEIELKPFFDYYEKMEEMSKAIYEKHAYIYLDSIKDLLSEKDKKIVEARALDKYKRVMDSEGIYFSMGNLLTGPTLVESFSDENTEKLNDESSSQWAKESIKEDRIKYFKRLGIDNGSDYEAYMSDPKCVALIPDKALISRITEEKKKAYIHYQKEVMLTMPHHKEILEELDNSHLLVNPEFALTTSNEMTCITDCYTVKDGKVELQPVLYFDGRTADDIYDCTLIHELNHLYELCTKGIENNKITNICGWDIIESTIVAAEEERDSVDRSRRRYEMFNEIINEFIAQDISKILHEDMKVSVCGDLDKAINSSHTSYQMLIGVFVKPFYERFREDIIESRKDGNIDLLTDRIGKESFEEFNTMLNEFSSRFQGMKIYKLKRQLMDKEENEDTKYFYDCIEKTKGFLDKFQENKEAYLENDKKNI